MAKKKKEKKKIVKKILKTTKEIKKPKIVCPDCGAEITSSLVEGQVIECPDCGAKLEVVKKGAKLDVELIMHEEEKMEVEAPEWEEYE
jgi:lysine biosynthesis protein LysW